MAHRLSLAVLCLPALAACSIQQIAIDGLAGALSSAGNVFSSEEDPELARDALPFALKSIEAVLAADPENEDLLLAACSGFAQYGQAFVAADARRMEYVDYEESLRLQERALGLYLRALGYGLRGLELRHPGISEELRLDPTGAAATLELEDLPLAYWTAAAWGLAISVGLDRPEISADVDAPRALLRRTLELDEAWEAGSIHEASIVLEALPEAMGGSPQRAREHFERAVELSDGNRAGPYVIFAESVCVTAQDRPEFEALLREALAVDLDAAPANRLANRLAQDHARHLLGTADDLFLEPLD